MTISIFLLKKKKKKQQMFGNAQNTHTILFFSSVMSFNKIKT